MPIPEGLLKKMTWFDNVKTSKTAILSWQGQQFPALLTDPSLSGQGGAGSPQVILVSHTPQSSSAAGEEIAYQVWRLYNSHSAPGIVREGHVWWPSERGQPLKSSPCETQSRGPDLCGACGLADDGSHISVSGRCGIEPSTLMLPR